LRQSCEVRKSIFGASLRICFVVIAKSGQKHAEGVRVVLQAKVDKAVRRHSGTTFKLEVVPHLVLVESSAKQGATIVFSLPLRQPS
jgi:hypothetical protein